MEDVSDDLGVYLSEAKAGSDVYKFVMTVFNIERDSTDDVVTFGDESSLGLIGVFTSPAVYQIVLFLLEKARKNHNFNLVERRFELAKKLSEDGKFTFEEAEKAIGNALREEDARNSAIQKIAKQMKKK